MDEAARRRLDLPLQAGDGSTLDNGVPTLGNCTVPSELSLATVDNCTVPSELTLASGLTEKRAEFRP